MLLRFAGILLGVASALSAAAFQTGSAYADGLLGGGGEGGGLLAGVGDTVQDVVEPPEAPAAETSNEATRPPLLESITRPVGQALQPVVDDTVAPLVETVAPVVDSITRPVGQALQPIVDDTASPILDSVAVPVLEPLQPVVESVVGPVLEPLIPVVGDTADPVLKPIVDGVARPVVEPVSPVIASAMPATEVQPVPPVVPLPSVGLPPTGVEVGSVGSPADESTRRPMPGALDISVAVPAAGAMSNAAASPSEETPVAAPVRMAPSAAIPGFAGIPAPGAGSADSAAPATGTMGAPVPLNGSYLPSGPRVLMTMAGSLSAPNTVGERVAAVVAALSLGMLLSLSWRSGASMRVPASCSYAPAVGPD